MTAMRRAFAACLISLALALALLQSAAGGAPASVNPVQPAPADAAKQTQRLEQLEEVLVEGGQSVEDYTELASWLERLVGAYTVSGSMRIQQLEALGAFDVEGAITCNGFRGQLAPAIHCDIDVRWPGSDDVPSVQGGIPALQPAAMLYGYAYDGGPIIRHLLVDQEGQAEGASGSLLSPDVMFSRAKCLSVPDGCERVVKVSFGPDPRQVTLDISVSTEQGLTQTLAFTLRRKD